MKYKKVTEPDKKITSKFALKQIKKAGFNSDYVEFYKDYGDSGSPFVKTYRCRKTDKHIAVVSTLPRTNSQGEKIDVGFDFIDGKYVSKKNLFECEIDGNQVYLKHERKTSTYTPQLFIDGIEQISSGPALMNDPYNENYKDNYIEWLYPTCRRTIRIFEGRYRERWHFPEIDGKIEINHNFKGTLKVNLGFAEDENGKVDIKTTKDKEIFEGKATNLVIGGTDDFTADLDGYAVRNSGGGTWTDLRDGNGTGASDSSSIGTLRITSDSTSSQWLLLYRFLFSFDTSTISGNVEGGSFSIHGIAGANLDYLSITPSTAVYGTVLDSDTAIINSDFEGVTDTIYSDVISYAAFDDSDYNEFTLNESGIAAISPAGYTELSLRNKNYDGDDSAPSWSNPASSFSQVAGYFAEQGVGYEPKLTVVYQEKTEYIDLNTPINNIINLSCPIDLE